MKVFNISPILKYKMPSWLYRGKWVDYGICMVSVSPQTPPKGMLWQHFHYDDSSMYVCDCGWYKLCMAESVVPGKVSISMVKTWVSRYRIWQLRNMPMTCNLLPNDDSTAPRFCWHALLSLYGHEAHFIHFIQHCHALHIHVLTVAKSTFVAALLWKHYHWSAGAEKHAEGGLLC